jgi:hypothetical protein
MSVLDKIKKMKERNPQQGSNSRMTGIFHDYEDGDNNMRLVGDFVEVNTHFIAPVASRKEKGLCQEDAFQGDNRIQKVINCLDWDIEKEQKKDVKVCPICKINKIAYKIMDEILDEVGGKDKLELEENAAVKKEYEKFSALARLARPRTSLKWNIIDRNNPEVKMVTDGKEEKVLSLKIATLGQEAWAEVEGIFDQCGFDITDTEDGIDICIKKGHNGTRTAYSANAIIERGSVLNTPLTEEERALVPHDISKICGKQTDADAIMDALHGEYRELLDLNEDAQESAPQVEEKAEAVEEAPAKEEVPAKEEPVAEETPSKVAVVDDVEDEFEDFLEDDSEKKN